MIAPVAWLSLLAAGWAGALGRACWQGGLALALAGALCRLLPRLPGRVQCWLWRLAYLKLLVALVWGAPLELPVLPAASHRPPVVRRHTPTSWVPAGAKRQWPAAGGQAAHVGHLPGAAERTTYPGQFPIASAAGDWRLTTGACSWLLLLWLLGAGCSALRVRADWRRAQRLRRRGMAVRDELLIAECRALCRRLGVRREPVLLTAAEINGPVLVGVARPAIILPDSFPAQFAPGPLRLMLAHELAHLKRCDLLWAWLPNLGRVLFFFHPLVWLAEAEWRLAQEMACDEQVVLRTGASRAGYGSMLLEVMGRSRSPVPAGLLTVAAAESYGAVRRRLAAIGQIRSVSRQCRAWSSLLLAAAAIGGVIPWRLTAVPARPQPPLRQGPRAGSPPERPMAQASSSPERLVRILDLRRRGAGLARNGSSSEHPRIARPALRRQRLWAEAPGRSRARVSRRDHRSRLAAAQSLSAPEGGSSLQGEVPVSIASQPEEAAKRGVPGASNITGDAPRTPRPVIVAELPPRGVQPAPDRAARLEPLSPPFASLEMTDADLPQISPPERKQADSAPDPSSGGPGSIALAQKIDFLKRVRDFQMLLVPQPLAGVSGLTGWKAPPFFPGPKGVRVRVEGNGNAAELKRLIGEAVQNGALDPGALQKMLSAATHEGEIDPRVLKKMLAAVDQAEDTDPAPFAPQGGIPPKNKLLLRLDQQKREMQKQQAGGKPGDKPFLGIDPDF